MNIVISTSSGKPIYEQIATQIKAQIMDGSLAPGSELPSIRGLAKSLRVSVITVQRAYEEMQRDGFIDAVAGRGSFVAYQNQDFYREEQQRLAEQRLAEAAQIGRTYGISLETLTESLENFYQTGGTHAVSIGRKRLK
jgi:GntR family transcriptional regulator